MHDLPPEKVVSHLVGEDIETHSLQAKAARVHSRHPVANTGLPHEGLKSMTTGLLGQAVELLRAQLAGGRS